MNKFINALKSIQQMNMVTIEKLIAGKNSKKGNTTTLYFKKTCLFHENVLVGFDLLSSSSSSCLEGDMY